MRPSSETELGIEEKANRPSRNLARACSASHVRDFWLGLASTPLSPSSLACAHCQKLSAALSELEKLTAEVRFKPIFCNLPSPISKMKAN